MRSAHNCERAIRKIYFLQFCTCTPPIFSLESWDNFLGASFTASTTTRSRARVMHDHHSLLLSRRCLRRRRRHAEITGSRQSRSLAHSLRCLVHSGSRSKYLANKCAGERPTDRASDAILVAHSVRPPVRPSECEGGAEEARPSSPRRR